MQPSTLAVFMTLIPLIASNIAYIMSASAGHIPWCIPYIDGCTTVSRAARSGDTIFFFRALMMAYSILLLWFWAYAYQWLKILNGKVTRSSHIILWLGVIGALFLIVYIDFLGTTGEVNRFMRRFGIIIFFTFTPLAQLLMLNQHYNHFWNNRRPVLNIKVLRYQLIILLLMLFIGIVSVVLGLTQTKTYESENIVEWNYSFLLCMYFGGMVFLWKDVKYSLVNTNTE